MYIPRLLLAMNEDDTDRRLEYCEWFESMMRDEAFTGKVVWSDEAQFRLNGTVNRHHCVYWSYENPHVHLEKHINLPGLNVWCDLSSRSLIGPFFYEGTVTGALYLDMLQTSILPAIRELYEDESLQQDGAPPHYLPDIRMYVDKTNWTIDRSKRCCSVSTTVPGSNTSRLLPIGVPKG